MPLAARLAPRGSYVKACTEDIKFDNTWIKARLCSEPTKNSTKRFNSSYFLIIIMVFGNERKSYVLWECSRN